MLDFTDVQDTLLDLIADRSSGDLRPALQDLLPRMVGALAAKSSTLRVKFLTAPAKHGKTLLHPWLKDQLSAYKHIAIQLHRQLKQQDAKCGGKELPKFASTTSKEVCMRLLQGVLSHPGCMLIVVEECDVFVKDGQAGTLAELLQLTQGTPKQVKFLGLTRESQIQSLLSQHGFLKQYLPEEFCIDRMSVEDIGKPGACPMHLLKSLLMIPPQRLQSLGEAAAEWNADVASTFRHHHCPSPLQSALQQGDATPLHLVNIALFAVRSSADKQAWLHWDDVVAGAKAVFGSEPNQSQRLLAPHCSPLQACLMAAAFRQRRQGDVMMNFETVYPHYQQLVDRLHPNEQHNKNAAWAAFNGLVKSGVFDENRQGAVHSPPDHRPVQMMACKAQVQQTIREAELSDFRKQWLLRFIR